MRVKDGSGQRITRNGVASTKVSESLTVLHKATSSRLDIAMWSKTDNFGNLGSIPGRGTIKGTANYLGGNHGTHI